MRPALPVAHLAGMKAAKILRSKRSPEERKRQDKREDPRHSRGLQTIRSRGTNGKSLGHVPLSRLLDRTRRGDRSRRSQALQRVHGIIELEILDAFLLQVIR